MPTTQFWAIAQPYVGGVVRHLIGMAGIYLAAKGLPGLDDGTVTNLTAVATGGLGIAASIGWSMVEKKLRTKAP